MGAGLADTEAAVAKSVLFASLFDYPLTLAQLRQTLIGCQLTPTQIVRLYEQSVALQQIVDRRDGLFFPRSRPELPAIRARRERDSRAFLDRHGTFLRLACAMPFVRMVALSGSLAHLNLEDGGDLDLFVVTRGRHAWCVAVALVLLARLMRERHVVCANFVMADTRLELEPDDLFTASQLVHLRPLVGHDVHRALVAANPFVFDHYPNAHVPATPVRPARLAAMKAVAEAVLHVPAAIAETCCRLAYRSYLRAQSGRWTSPDQVQLDDDRLKLHTRSHRHSVLQRFERLVREELEGGAAAASVPDGGPAETAARPAAARDAAVA